MPFASSSSACCGKVKLAGGTKPGEVALIFGLGLLAADAFNCELIASAVATPIGEVGPSGRVAPAPPADAGEAVEPPAVAPAPPLGESIALLKDSMARVSSM